MDIELILQRIGGYISNLGKLKELLQELEPFQPDQAIHHTESLIAEAKGAWLTDLKILRNAIEEAKA